MCALVYNFDCQNLISVKLIFHGEKVSTFFQCQFENFREHQYISFFTSLLFFFLYVFIHLYSQAARLVPSRAAQPNFFFFCTHRVRFHSILFLLAHLLQVYVKIIL